MAYNLGTNIGAVENGNPTGQAYATKIVRTFNLSVTFTASPITQNCCILAADGTNNGIKTVPITSPFINGTKPKHLTINNVRANTNSGGLLNAGVGVLIFSQPPTLGTYTTTACTPFSDTSTQNIAYSYLPKDNITLWTAYSPQNQRTGLWTVNQVISTTTFADITNLYVCLILGTTAYTPVAGTVVNLQIDVSFE